MSIHSSLSPNGEELIIIVQGRFDFSSLQSFKNCYENQDKTPVRYIVDLKSSDYLDSSALGMLLALRDHAGGDNADVRIVNCSPDIRKIFLITKLDELFKVESS